MNGLAGIIELKKSTSIALNSHRLVEKIFHIFFHLRNPFRDQLK